MRLPFNVSLYQLVYAGLGFVPILCLSLSFFGVIPLHASAQYIILPTFLAAIVMGLYKRELGYQALTGLLAGIVATALYDVFRLSLVWAGVFQDFIPNIGRLALLDDHANPFWGYLWRFICNGGGMGMAFGILPFRGARQGISYGIFICCCLFGTLLFAPGAQQALFHLTTITAAGALVGHVIYGGALGGLTRMWLQSSAKSDQRRKTAAKRQTVIAYVPGSLAKERTRALLTLKIAEGGQRRKKVSAGLMKRAAAESSGPAVKAHS